MPAERGEDSRVQEEQLLHCSGDLTCRGISVLWF